MKENVYDACIIGTGAGGGPISATLSEAGLKTVILEKGPLIPSTEFSRDELKYIIRGNFTPDISKQPIFFQSTDSNVPTLVNKVGRNPQMVGGSTVHYEARAWRLQPLDFIQKSLFGSVGGTSIEDWPISYKEMEPYYTKAEIEIGVSGDGGQNPYEGFRSKPYPCPPIEGRQIDQKIRGQCINLGLHPFHTPLSIISRPYRGRNRCSLCGFCSGFGCSIDAKSSTLVTVIRRAIQSGNCTLIPNAVAINLVTNKYGKISEVVYKDRTTKKEMGLKARIFILAAGAIDTTRLLLSSTDNRNPNGLGNSSGLVGKNLMYHLFGWIYAEFPEKLNGYSGVASNVALDDYYNLSKLKLSTPLGGTCNFMLNSLPIVHGLRAHRGIRIGYGFKTHLQKFDQMLKCHIIKNEMPSEENKITLHPQIKDEWGMPAPVIHHSYREDDIAATDYIIDRMTEILDLMGGTIKWKKTLSDLQLDHHRLGTCRFGENPDRSVLNKNCQSHDIANLYVVDGAFFPTSGGYNPSLTIEANSFRVGEVILKNSL